MIRKAVIVGLTLGAVGTLALIAVSWNYTWYREFKPPDGACVVVCIDVGGLGVASRAVDESSIYYSCPGGRPGWRSRPPRWELSLSKKLRRTLALPSFRRVGQQLLMELTLWAPFILFAAYPTIAFIRGPLRRRRKRRRRKRGECVACGYNLTGNVSGVCPECGADLDGALTDQ